MTTLCLNKDYIVFIEVTKKVLIIGGEGHGSVIAACINDNRCRFHNYDLEVAGFINDYEKHIDHYPVVGGTSAIKKLAEQGYYFAWGIHLIGRNHLTYKTYERINIPLDRLVTVVHHSAFISDGVTLDPGVLVMAHSYIGPRTHIGAGSMIKANVCMGHDIECGPLCHFAMGSIVGSYTHLGICSSIATGSVTLEKLSIGNYSMLGSHSLLTHDIPEGMIYVGSPAKFFKDLKE